MRAAGDDDGAAALESGLYDDPDSQQQPVPKPDKRKIDENLFWEIVGKARTNAAEQALEIAARLECFPATQIKAFDKLLRAKMQELNHFDFWALAFLRNDGCSDDAFEAFRAWTLMQGPDIAALALKDPATFLDRTGVAGECDGSGLLFAPAMACFRRSGKALPAQGKTAVEVQGRAWVETSVAAA